MNPTSRIFIAGNATMTGRAIREGLEARGFTSILPAAQEPDLRDAVAVDAFFEQVRPELVFVAAGKSAGIVGNQQAPADLMVDNLRIATHVIPSAWKHGTRKLLYIASSCTFPKAAPQPLSVDSLWTGPLEPSSASYAVAKLAGLQLCEAFRKQHGVLFVSAIAADAYGPGDDFDPDNSHVVGALIRRMHEARVSDAPVVDVWGSGTPRREFIYATDLADACIFSMERYEGTAPLNLGIGKSTSIAELAEEIRLVVGYAGDVRFDRSKPDGMPFKGLDSTPLRDLGWRPRTDLTTGLQLTYKWFQEFF